MCFLYFTLLWFTLKLTVPRQKKLTPFRFPGFRKSQESSISVSSFFLSETGVPKGAPVSVMGDALDKAVPVRIGPPAPKRERILFGFSLFLVPSACQESPCGLFALLPPRILTVSFALFTGSHSGLMLREKETRKDSARLRCPACGLPRRQASARPSRRWRKCGTRSDARR